MSSSQLNRLVPGAHPSAPPVARGNPDAAPDTHLERPPRPGSRLGLEPKDEDDKPLRVPSSRHSNTAAPVYTEPTPLSWLEKKVPEQLATPTKGIPSDARAELGRDAHPRGGAQRAIDPSDPRRWIGRRQGRVDADFLSLLGLQRRRVSGEEEPNGGPIPEPGGSQA